MVVALVDVLANAADAGSQTDGLMDASGGRPTALIIWLFPVPWKSPFFNSHYRRFPMPYGSSLLNSLVFTTLATAGAFVYAQQDPLPDHIDTTNGLIVVDAVEFATLPDSDGEAARMMNLVDEPVSQRMFVNDMRGAIYTLSYDGRTVTPYVNINDTQWGVGVQSGGRERGFQSFALHPDFGRAGAPGYGRFYTWTDVTDNTTAADFVPDGGNNAHHTVLHEWLARNPAAAAYDGAAPRALMGFEQPFANHNAGHLAFNPLAQPGDADYGMLYIGSADGGSGGDPLNLSLNLASAFGKMLRIDPLGNNSANGQYGIPSDNPFTGQAGVVAEIFAYGMRNPQRFGWDPANGNLYMADIGQNMVEKVSLVPKGGNLGWNAWEGSFRFTGQGQISTDSPRSDPNVVYPAVEFTRFDPLVQNRVAVTGVMVYRDGPVAAMNNKVFFGDSVSGEILHFDADNVPEGGNEGISRLVMRDGSGENKTLLQLIRLKNQQQGRSPAERADLRINMGPDKRVFVLNKHDGVVRELVGR
jgi:hypothetical protein